MKNFFSIKHFKELKVLFVLEIIMVLLITMLISVNRVSIDYNYFSWKALLLTLLVWGLSSIIEPKKYFNLADLLALGSFMYFLWWFVLFMFGLN